LEVVAYRSNDNVEVAAVLVPLAVEPGDLDAVIGDLAKLPGVSHATWSISALE
jgi:putative Mg2+ transporter-C (MgtC) family protein